MNGLTRCTGLWSRGFVTPATLDEFQSYVDGTQRNELFDRISVIRQGVLHGSRLDFLLGFSLGIALAILPIAAVIAVWQRIRQPCPDSRLVVAAVGAWAVHSHLLFVGLFGVMAGRYADSMAPMMAVTGTLLTLWAFDRLVIKTLRPKFREPSPSEGKNSQVQLLSHFSRHRFQQSQPTAHQAIARSISLLTLELSAHPCYSPLHDRPTSPAV